jgi:hypothetical protein
MTIDWSTITIAKAKAMLRKAKAEERAAIQVFKDTPADRDHEQRKAMWAATEVVEDLDIFILTGRKPS